MLQNEHQYQSNIDPQQIHQIPHNQYTEPQTQLQQPPVEITIQQKDIKQNTQNIIQQIKLSHVYPNQTRLEDFAKEALYSDQDQQVSESISIQVKGSIQKGNFFTQYTAYIIIGKDEKGEFQVLRRYSQFDALRQLLQKRWPGCFIPMIPQKTTDKNNKTIIASRQRILDNFVKKIGSSKYIYYSAQFQQFLRSSISDLSDTFTKKQDLSMTELVERYKDTFQDLAGRQINSDVSIKISEFKTSLKKLLQQLPSLQQLAIKLVRAKERFNQKLPRLFTILNRYESSAILQYSDKNPKHLLFQKPENNEIFSTHKETLNKINQENPYYLIEDLVAIQIKDCESFIKSIQSIDDFDRQRIQIQLIIRENEQEIEELALGRATLNSMTSRKPKQEIRIQLEQKNKKFIVFKHQLIEMSDMIKALLGFIQIERYKTMKKKYYSNMMNKISGTQGFLVLNLIKIWTDIQNSTSKSLLPDKVQKQVSNESQNKTIKELIE